MRNKREKYVYIVIALVYIITAIYICFHHISNGTTQFLFMGPVSLLFLLAPPLAEKVFRQPLGFSFKVFVLTFSYFAFSLGVALRWYDHSAIYDKVMHLFSGLLFFCLGFYMYSRFDKSSSPYRLTDNWVLQMTYAFFFSMTIAVVWEIYEFLGFVIVGHDAQHHLTTGVFDTMQDIIACFIGTFVYALFYALYAKKKKRTFFIAMLESITPEEKI